MSRRPKMTKKSDEASRSRLVFTYDDDMIPRRLKIGFFSIISFHIGTTNNPLTRHVNAVRPVQKLTYPWPRLREKACRPRRHGEAADRLARIRLVIFTVLELSARGHDIKNEKYPHTTLWSLRRLGRNIYYILF